MLNLAKRSPKKKNLLKDQSGMAVIEAVPLLVIFVMMFSFGLGFFGAIHTATLHSISARAYAFETFRQRSNLTYFREDGSGLKSPMHYKTKGFRYHGISHETDLKDSFVSTLRPIAIGREIASDASVTTHNQGIFDLEDRNQKVSVSPLWIMVGYGICIDQKCGR